MRRDGLILIVIVLLLGVVILTYLNRAGGGEESLRGGGGDERPAIPRREPGIPEDPPPIIAERPNPTAPSEEGVAETRSETTPGPRSRTGRIDGRVVDAEGRPLFGVRVELQALDFQIRPGDDPPPPGPLRLETTTDTEGRFEFTDLPDRTRALLDAATAQGDAWGQAEVWSNTRVTLHLFGGAVIEGSVRDESGRLLPGLLVTSIQLEAEDALDADDFFNGALVARSDVSGRFALRGLPPGELKLGCRDENWWLESEVIEIGDRDRLQVDLVARPTRTIAGRVLRGGSPVRMAEVMAVPESGSWREGMRGGTAQTDDEGRFTIRGLRPGSFTVTIQNGLGPLQKMERSRRGEKLPEAKPRPFKQKGVASGTMDLVLDLDDS